MAETMVAVKEASTVAAMAMVKVVAMAEVQKVEMEEEDTVAAQQVDTTEEAKGVKEGVNTCPTNGTSRAREVEPRCNHRTHSKHSRMIQMQNTACEGQANAACTHRP